MLLFLFSLSRYFSGMSLFKHAIPLFAACLFLPSCGGDLDAEPLASESRASEKTAQALYNSAYAAEKAGKLRRARSSYGKIVQRYPLFPSAPEAAYRWGKLLERDREPLEAFEAYDAILTRYPASPHYSESVKRQETIAHQAATGHITNSFVGIKSRIDLDKTAVMLGKVRDNAPRADSAEKAQYTIGKIYQTRGSGATGAAKAIAAFRQLTRDYPDSKYSPAGQYLIGEILLTEASKGNQDSANLDRAKRAFEDVTIRYPDTKQAKLAEVQITKLTSGDIQSSFDIAEFYRKKGQTSSALFYYRDTVNRAQPGALRSQAQKWIDSLTAR
ncbi:MAG: outer membrane protein assembly factor BamD [Akkermansiaceae bacterium]|jgi:outer membrane protein assembly factor BamD